MKPRSKLIFWYALGDVLASLLAWYCLYFFRKVVIENNAFDWLLPFQDKKFFVGLVIVSQLWLLIHYFVGTYTDVYRKSRLQELTKTLLVTLVGAVVIFFLLLLDDRVCKYSDYYFTFLVLYAAQSLFTLFMRLLCLSYAKCQLLNKRVGFNTLLIGSNEKANQLHTELAAEQNKFGYHFVGYVAVQRQASLLLTQQLVQLGTLPDLERIVTKHNIEEVMIAIESDEHHLLNEILNKLADKKVWIRIIPDMYDILSGTAKMNSVMGEAFIEIPPDLISESERISKRWFDITCSLLAIVVLSPFLLFIALYIRFSSSGSILYSQERLGQYGRPFRMLKFRSMYTNAEEQGPQLTKDDDPRVTPIGKFMRKYRIDELPQFWNVLVGEMSLVGPRAERKYFAEKIVAKAPHYKHVLKVKPGITSLGMVKYGYASNVEEMVKRLKYDLIYIENMSIVLDFKIIIYTVLTVLYGRGK